MAGKNGKKNNTKLQRGAAHIPQKTKQAIAVVLLMVAALLLTLAGLGVAGPAGADIKTLFASLLGIGYFLMPTSSASS